jgi:uncharacterized protein (DUF58 family)
LLLTLVLALFAALLPLLLLLLALLVATAFALFSLFVLILALILIALRQNEGSLVTLRRSHRGRRKKRQRCSGSDQSSHAHYDLSGSR